MSPCLPSISCQTQTPSTTTYMWYFIIFIWKPLVAEIESGFILKWVFWVSSVNLPIYTVVNFSIGMFCVFIFRGFPYIFLSSLLTTVLKLLPIFRSHIQFLILIPLDVSTLLIEMTTPLSLLISSLLAFVSYSLHVS